MSTSILHGKYIYICEMVYLFPAERHITQEHIYTIYIPSAYMHVSAFTPHQCSFVRT